MKSREIVAGLDLGTTRTTAVIGAVTGDVRLPSVRILGVGVARETGVRAGVVRDIEATTKSIMEAMRDAERMAGLQVPAVHCGIAGEHVLVRSSTGLASVSSEEVSRADVNRVDEVAKAVSLGGDRELVHDIPLEYKVDSQGGISDPVGMTGLRLEVEMDLVSVQFAAAQNIRKSVGRAGFRVAALVLEPLAAALSVLTEEEKELGCALLDLGGGATGIAVFQEGKTRHIGSLPYAGHHLSSDIVQGLGITQADAERLKEKWGQAYEPLVDPEEMIEIPSTPGQGLRQAKRELLAHIIHARLDEIFGLVQQEIDEAGYLGHLPAGVIMTGGGAHLPGVVELAREVFATPARVGVPDRGISGLVDSVQAPRYAVSTGLVLYAARELFQRGMNADFGVERVLGPVKRWLQEFF